MSHTRSNRKKYLTIDEVIARFEQTLSDLKKEASNASFTIFTTDFFEYIERCLSLERIYLGKERTARNNGAFTSKAEQLFNQEFTCARNVFAFLDDLFAHVAEPSSSWNLDSFVERFNQLLIEEEIALRQARDMNYSSSKLKMRIGVALLAITIAIVAILCVTSPPFAILFLVGGLAMFIASGGLGAILGANNDNNLTTREKMLNKNISLLGKVKSTLFGATAEHSSTRLDNPLNDLPEPIKPKPLLFTCG